jgi:hypothetical protein
MCHRITSPSASSVIRWMWTWPALTLANFNEAVSPDDLVRGD